MSRSFTLASYPTSTWSETHRDVPLHADADKRVLDVILTLACFVLALPFVLIVPLLIKLTSPGPVLYRQVRIGQHGQRFTMLKFRSMRVDAEPEGRARWTREQDPRITAVGRILRRYHIDELPQLLNVLAGDMSFVGPRPERPEFVELLEKELPGYAVRHKVKPGITGWAQVRYRYAASIEETAEKLAHDLHYLRHQSLVFDCRIVWLTIGAVLTTGGR